MTLTDLCEQYENELQRYAARLTRDPGPILNPYLDPQPNPSMWG